MKILYNYALGHDKSTLVTLLQDKSITFDQDDLNEALLECSIYGSRKVLRLLIECGADINFKDPTSGQTVLHKSVNNPKNFKYLLAKKANKNESCDLGMTPLHYAVFNICPDSAFMLLNSRNIKLDIKDKDGATPLDYALNNNNLKMFSLLVFFGVNVKKCVTENPEFLKIINSKNPKFRAYQVIRSYISKYNNKIISKTSEVKTLKSMYHTAKCRESIGYGENWRVVAGKSCIMPSDVMGEIENSLKTSAINNKRILRTGSFKEDSIMLNNIIYNATHTRKPNFSISSISTTSLK
ncbi:MAG: ankyrin repeat domain-containing protein [Alphaproteobacteria bacterium]|nr:ankyrin repeat domain-containing protein [Alphaproteobacteria bacterium]OJV16283.1 MAG: hypothetical protein BGO27_02905 [Alphaproteobacteria bacterium 33-17]